LAAVNRQGACQGGDTRQIRTTEHMEECRVCGERVRFDLVDHPFFGFRAGCDKWKETDP
jgi:hypothetical protein